MTAEFPPEIPRAQVWRFLGYPAGRRPPERVRAQLDALLCEASGLIKPRGIHARFPRSEAPAVGLAPPESEMTVSGFALALVTIGPGLETRATAALERGDAGSALLLDAVGSAAVEAAADRLGATLGPGAQNAASAPCRISPGYGDWPLLAQAELFARLPHQEIEVRLLPSMLMVPRKSVSFAVWFDPAGHAIRARADCTRCERGTCPQREERQRGGEPERVRSREAERPGTERRTP